MGELNWKVVYDRPDLQIVAGTLMMRDTYRSILRFIRDPIEAYPFADSAYNGGERDVLAARRACQTAKNLGRNCNPNIWFNNVENYCMKSKVPLYAGRSACDINIHHVRDVYKRAPKYYKLMRS